MSTAARKHKEVSPWLISAGFAVILLVNFMLFYFWSEANEAGHPWFDKVWLVIAICVLTALQAYGIMALSMHLSKERQFIVGVATLPFLTVVLAIIPTLIDIMTLKGNNLTYNIVPTLHEYNPHGHAKHHMPGMVEPEFDKPADEAASHATATAPASDKPAAKAPEKDDE